MAFSVIDWIFSGLILIFSVVGFSKGFIENVFGKLAFILGVIFACLFYKEVGSTFLKDIGNSSLQSFLGFLIVFVVVFLIIKLVQAIISKVFTWTPLKSLDRTLGLCFGIIEGLAIVYLLLFLLSVQPFFSAERLIDGSFFHNIISTFLSKNSEIALQGISNV